MGELLWHIDVVQCIIDAAGCSETNHIPVAEKVHVLDGYNECQRTARSAILEQHPAGVQILGVQQAAAVAPLAGQAVAITLCYGLSPWGTLAGNDRDMFPEDGVRAGVRKVCGGRSGAYIASHHDPAG